jgi:hypothetical protein
MTAARLVLLAGLVSCGDKSGTGPGPDPVGIVVIAGADQQGSPGSPLPSALRVRVTDSLGTVVAGANVDWLVRTGGGSLSAGATSTAADGTTEISWTLGPLVGGQEVLVVVDGLDPVVVHATATGALAVLGGGGNVPERYSSDLWVSGQYAYVGTWNWFQRTAGVTGAIKVFQLGGNGAPVLVDSVIVPGVLTISDLEVSPDSQWLVATAEGGSGEGLYVYSLADPAAPAQVAFAPVSAGLHTGSLSTIGGKLYAFTAKNPSSPAMLIFDLSDAANDNITIASTTPIPPFYGIHDTFVRDGVCFAFVWNEGVYIYDVGNGVAGGTPQVPVRVGNVQTAGGQAHNGWWFWNPVNGEKKYLFVGEEGPGSIGSSSSGDIHVVDVSDLANPVEVATYAYPTGAGTHNFWMDEANQRLYAAYYDGGVVALDVSGTLNGNLANREIARLRPGGTGDTYVWGVMLAGTSLYVADMLSGFWQIGVP